MESAVLLAGNRMLGPEAIQLGRSNASLVTGAGMTLAEIERSAILAALRRHNGNRQLTAEELGVSTRTIQRKIQEYGLPF